MQSSPFAINNYGVVTLHTARTDELSSSFLIDLRRLLEAAFPGDFSDHDWRHTLGGTHVWLLDDDGLIAHGSVVPRTLTCAGSRLRTGYVEAIATIASRRRQGHATKIMKRLNGLIQDHYQLGALSTGTHAFYESVGWSRWRGPSFVDRSSGRARTPDDDDSIMILRTPRSPALDLDGDIACDWRLGDVW